MSYTIKESECFGLVWLLIIIYPLPSLCTSLEDDELLNSKLFYFIFITVVRKRQALTISFNEI